MTADTVLLDDWHPVADAGALRAGKLAATGLLGRDLVIWRDRQGQAHAWEDRCPHRGTRLSIGRQREDTLECAYHGWRFEGSGKCVHFPALPDVVPPDGARARTYTAREAYGLIWVCMGNAAREPPPFPEYHDPRLRKVLCGAYPVATSGPRIVENFLDMAHFPFVHGGILGDEPHAALQDYSVGPYDDGEGGTGIIATECFAWQPQTNTLAHGGSLVEYTYRVVRPLTAILTKVPERQKDFREAISLHVQPLGEEESRVWIVLALTNFEHDDTALRGFQDRIFLQDRPIVENQVPKRLPLVPGAEMPIRSDRMSLAYRKYLRESGLRYGVVPTDVE